MHVHTHAYTHKLLFLSALVFHRNNKENGFLKPATLVQEMSKIVDQHGGIVVEFIGALGIRVVESLPTW